MLVKLFLVVAMCNLAFGADPIVQTLNGRLRGREARTQTGKPYYSFQKVPFAAPPVNALRFKAPQPVANWDGIRDASKNMEVMCHNTYQDYDQENEDCLYLNVFTPQIPGRDNITSQLPIMLWIFGGGFVWGNPDPNGMYRPDHLIDSGVIVVSVNYRLGPLGFLSTEDLLAPGNNGLKDQLAAIKWIRANARAFGGDQDRITIFGQSAGAIGVAYQLLNTKSQGLFAGAILESGSYLMPCSLTRNPRQIAFALGGILNDQFNRKNNSQELLDYLRTVPPRSLDSAATRYQWRENEGNRQMANGFYYSPVIEPEHVDAMFTEKMYGQVKKGKVVKVPVIIGLNSEETIGAAGDKNGFMKKLQQYDTNLGWFVPGDMRLVDNTRKANMGRQIKDIYVNGKAFASSMAAGVRFFSDSDYNKGIIKQAELQARHTRTWFYQFSFNGQLGRTWTEVEGAGKVGHGAEMSFIWFNGGNGNIRGFPQADQKVFERVQKMWTDFARYQNPTPQKSAVLQDIIWPLANSGKANDIVYLDIDKDLTVRTNPKGDTYAKWNNLYSSLGYDDFDTW